MQGFLKDTFRDHTPEPPRDLWAGIEGELRPRKRLAWLPYASAIAALLVVVVGLMWILASGEVARNQMGTGTAAPMAEAVAPAQATSRQAAHKKAETPVYQAIKEHLQVLHAPDEQPAGQPAVTPSETQRPQMPAIAPVSGKPLLALAGKSQPGQLQVQPVAQPALAAAPPPPSHKQEYDLSKVSVDDVLLFAARSLGRVADLPFAVYADNANPQQVKAYQVQLGDKFSIERKRAMP